MKCAHTHLYCAWNVFVNKSVYVFGKNIIIEIYNYKILSKSRKQKINGFS